MIHVMGVKALALEGRATEVIEEHRIAAHDYGACTECGRAIASERLQLDPHTTLCEECAPAGEADARLGERPVRTRANPIAVIRRSCQPWRKRLVCVLP